MKPKPLYVVNKLRPGIFLPVFFMLYFVPAFYINAQKDITRKRYKEVLVNYPDSTVKAIVVTGKKTIRTKQFLIYYWYHTGQIKKNMGGSYGDVLDGKYTVFDRDNNMITCGHFKKGLKHGQWKSWYAKGGLHQSEHWKRGKKTGVAIAFDRTGKSLYKLRYRNGLLHGKCEHGSDSSQIVTKYRKGIIIPEKKKVEKTSTDEHQQLTEEKKIKSLLKRLFMKKENDSSTEVDEHIDKQKDKKTDVPQEKKKPLKERIRSLFVK